MLAASSRLATSALAASATSTRLASSMLASMASTSSRLIHTPPCRLSASDTTTASSASSATSGRLDLGKNLSFGEKIYKKLFKRLPVSTVRPYAMTLFADCTQGVDLAPFLGELDMPDTFQTWFLVSELHLWMASVRLAAEADGCEVRNAMVDMLWKDCAERIKLLGGTRGSRARGRLVSSASEQFNASLFIYDEGIAGDDRALANAVWRRLLDCASDPGAVRKTELAVAYVRRTVAALDRTPAADLVSGAHRVRWLPLVPASQDCGRSSLVSNV